MRSGTDAGTALGGAELAVRRQYGGHEVTCLRLRRAGPATGSLARAALQVYAHVPAGDSFCTSLSVYARPGWQWAESTLTWNTVPLP